MAQTKKARLDLRSTLNTQNFQLPSVHLRTLGGWMEYVDPDTLNRFFYQNELVLRVSDDTIKPKVSARLNLCREVGGPWKC